MVQLLLDGVKKSFSTRGEPLHVLRGISLSLQSGDDIAVVGPSGSGKTTLLAILGTLDQPTDGRITFDGEDLAAMSPSQAAEFRRRHVGFVFQDHHLLPQCTVLENVLMPTLARGITRDEDVERAEMLLDRIGLGERLNHRPGELSGGERQRVALARALIFRPSLVLADEPTGNLDRTTAGQIAELLQELHRQEGTILVVVTHSLELARQLSQQWELDQGRLQRIETLPETCT